jgi:hypothetical protein
MMEILGGCRDLNLAGVWFSWCSRTDVVTAWRHVGVCADHIDDSQIDRSKFIDQAIAEEEKAHASPKRLTRADAGGAEPDPHSTPDSLEDAMKTPLGMRSGSAEAMKIKLERTKKFAQKLQAAGFDPTVVPGLMAPQVAAVKKRKRDMTRAESSVGGSARLRNLHGKAVEKREEKERLEREAEAKRQELAAKKQRVAEEARALAEAFELCQGGCVCGQEPCAVKGLKRCDTCKEIKQRVCIKRACVAARSALALTDESAMLALEDNSVCSFCDQREVDGVEAPLQPCSVPGCHHFLHDECRPSEGSAAALCAHCLEQ